MIKKLLLALIIVLSTATMAFADFILLNNGDVIVGDIISETDTTIVVRTSFGDITISKTDIKEIRKESTYSKGEIVEVLMFDGSRVRGTVVEDTKSILKLQTELGLIDIPKTNISNIVVGGITNSTSKTDETGTTGLTKEMYEKLLEYQKRAIFVDIFTFRGGKTTQWLIRSGGFILSEIDFLKTIGKPDLARAIEQDMSNRNAFMGTFIGVGVCASVISVIGIAGFTNAMSDDQAITLTVIGSVALVASIIGVIASLPKDHYLSYTEAKSYADEYNLKLRKELGLTVQDVSLIGGTEANDDIIDNVIEYMKNNIPYETIPPVEFSFGLIPTELGIGLLFGINF